MVRLSLTLKFREMVRQQQKFVFSNSSLGTAMGQASTKARAASQSESAQSSLSVLQASSIQYYISVFFDNYSECIPFGPVNLKYALIQSKPSDSVILFHRHNAEHCLNDYNYKMTESDNISAFAEADTPNKQDDVLIQNQDITKAFKMGNRATGVVLMILIIGTFFIYGWGTEIRLVTSSITSQHVNYTSQTIYGNLFILSSIFTVLGFGLLFTYFKSASASGIFMSLFIVSFTIITSPFLQKFWFNVFITDFQGTTPTLTDPGRFMKISMGGSKIEIDFYNMKIALSNAISQLVLMLGLFGRITPPQIVICSLLFNFAWNFNHFLCVLVEQYSIDQRIFDDYQISIVYLFGSTFGLVACQLIRKPIATNYFSHSSFSVIFAQLGTFFLFLSFCSTTTFFSLKFSISSNGLQFSRSYVWQEAFLGTFFSLSSSVITSYAFSSCFGQNRKIGVQQSLFGIILGGIIYGPVAGTCTNIAAAIVTGIVAGFFSALFYKKIYPKINKNGVRDTFGLLSIWIISFLATFVIAPIIIKAYYNNSMMLTTLQTLITDKVGLSIGDSRAASTLVAYVWITIGIGFFSGLLVGAIMKAVDKYTAAEFHDQMIFFLDQGLRRSNKMRRPFREGPPPASQGQIARNPDL